MFRFPVCSDAMEVRSTSIYCYFKDVRSSLGQVEVKMRSTHLRPSGLRVLKISLDDSVLISKIVLDDFIPIKRT